jgi:hypothetical protein
MHPEPKFKTAHVIEEKDASGKVIKRRKILGQPVGLTFSVVSGTIDSAVWSDKWNQWTYSIYPWSSERNSRTATEQSILPIEEWVHHYLFDDKELVLQTVNNLRFDSDSLARGAMSILNYYRALMSGRCCDMNQTIQLLRKAVKKYNGV